MLVVASRAEGLELFERTALRGIHVAVDLAERRPTARCVVHLCLERIEHDGVRVGTTDKIVLFVAHSFDCLINLRINRSARHRRGCHADTGRCRLSIDETTKVECKLNAISDRTLRPCCNRADSVSGTCRNRQIL